MHRIKMLVLDMAGTTINENNIVYKTVQQVINDAGFPVSLQDVLQHGAGKEKHKAIIDVLTNCTNATDISSIADLAFANFKPRLEKAYDENEIVAYDGMEAFFEELRKTAVIVVLNTGYDAATANKLMKKVGWTVGKEVDGLITSNDVANGRPHPDMINKAMKDFGIIDPLEVLKVGDSEIDILEGKNAGCGLTVAVLSGAQTREQLAVAQPDYILDNACQIAELILSK